MKYNIYVREDRNYIGKSSYIYQGVKYIVLCSEKEARTFKSVESAKKFILEETMKYANLNAFENHHFMIIENRGETK